MAQWLRQTPKSEIFIKSGGFSATSLIVALLVATGLVVGGWALLGDAAKPVASKQANTQNKTDPYAGWQTATSAMAGFSVKYPSNWAYSSNVGSKDGAEHITIDSAQFHVTIDSYSNPSSTTCVDCLDQSREVSFTLPGQGRAAVQTITYDLDDARGNALILRLASGIYYIPSKKFDGVSTTFRAISKQDSLQAYHAETPTQFLANPDYKIAQQILQSVSY